MPWCRAGEPEYKAERAGPIPGVKSLGSQAARAGLQGRRRSRRGAAAGAQELSRAWELRRINRLITAAGPSCRPCRGQRERLIGHSLHGVAPPPAPQRHSQVWAANGLEPSGPRSSGFFNRVSAPAPNHLGRYHEPPTILPIASTGSSRSSLRGGAGDRGPARPSRRRAGELRSSRPRAHREAAVASSSHPKHGVPGLRRARL